MFTTSAGWKLIVWGNLIGFCFAVWALVISVVSFPLLVDRDVGAAVADHHVGAGGRGQPGTDGGLGLDRRGAAVDRLAAAFIGLAVVMPVLGHATWHLYRKMVDAGSSPRARFPVAACRDDITSADFPVSLFYAIGVDH